MSTSLATSGSRAESPNGGCVLLVDDCSEARALMAQELADAGFRVVEAEGGESAWQAWSRSRSDLIVSDVRMPTGDGLELLRRVRDVSNVPVILVTAHADVPTALAALRSGAAELLRFPDEIDQLVPRTRALLAGRVARDAVAERLVGASAAMEEVRGRVRGLLALDVPVLVRGESGSGRDAVVEALHALRHGEASPLERVVPEDAAREVASGAAVYLDGIDRFPLAAQRIWCERLVRREHDAEAGRIYASCAEGLESAVAQGQVEALLAARLARFSIRVPALRRRLEDLDALVPALAARRGRELGRDGVRVDAAAVERLRAEPWPGNVRELDTVVARLVAFATDGSIDATLVERVLAERSDTVAALRSQRESQQRAELAALLAECRGNFAEVARRLDLTRGAVVYRAKRFGLFQGRRPDG